MSRTRMGDVGMSGPNDTNHEGQESFMSDPISSNSTGNESVSSVQKVVVESKNYEEISENKCDVSFNGTIINNGSIGNGISKEESHTLNSSLESHEERTYNENTGKNGFMEHNSRNQINDIHITKRRTGLSKLRDIENSLTKRDSFNFECYSSANGLHLTLPMRKSFSDENDSCVEDGLLPSNAKKIEDLHLVPPDGGWGWLAALGAFVVMMLVPSVGSCFSILFSDYLIEQKASSATTSWVFNTQMLIWHLVGPLVGPMVTEFGGRKIGFVGVTLVSMSMMISAFSPSAGFLFFSFSILSGLGGGLSASLCFIFVPQYFRDRQGMANAILMAGICMLQVAMVPLSRYLLDEYSFKPACLIYGAFLLNGLVGVSVFHPVKWHMKRSKVDINSEKIKMQNTTLKDKETDPSSNHVNQECLEQKKSSSVVKAKHLKQKSEIHTDSKHPKSRFRLLYEIVQRVIKQTLLNCKVMKMFRAIIISNAVAFSIVGYVNFLMILPFAMKEMDFSLEDASNVISLVGMSNMITRLTVSPLSDWKRFSKKTCIMSGYAIVAICMFVFPFLTSLVWMMALAVVMGCGIGANMSMNNLVMIKYLGMENLAAAFGVTNLEVGALSITFGPFIGFIRDITGSYTYSIWTMAGMLATSFCLWLFMPAAILWDTKKTSKEHVDR